MGTNRGEFVPGCTENDELDNFVPTAAPPIGVFLCAAAGTERHGTRNAGCHFTLEMQDYQHRERIMSILAWIIVGIIAGWLAERVTGRNHGLLTNLLVGIVGAFLGGFIFSSLLGFRYEEGFNLPSIVVATAGAVLLLAVTGGFRQRRTLP